MIEQETLRLAHQGDVDAMIKATEYFWNEEHNEEAALKWADRLSATLNVQALTMATTIYGLQGEAVHRNTGNIEETYQLYSKALSNIERIEKINGQYKFKDKILMLVAELYVLYMNSNYGQALEILCSLRNKGSAYAAYLILECHENMGKKKEFYNADICYLENLIEKVDDWPNKALKSGAYVDLGTYYSEDETVNISKFCTYMQKSIEIMSDYAESRDKMYAAFCKTKTYLLACGFVRSVYRHYKQEINKKTSLSTGEYIIVILGFLWWIIPGIIALVCFQNKAKSNRKQYPVTDDDLKKLETGINTLQQEALNTGILQYLPQDVITVEKFPEIYKKYEEENQW